MALTLASRLLQGTKGVEGAAQAHSRQVHGQAVRRGVDFTFLGAEGHVQN